MAAISSTVGTQAAAQVGYQQLRVQQAKQTAESAELVARAAQAKANAAQRTADRADAYAQSLAEQATQARNVAGQAYQGLATLKTVSNLQEGLLHVTGQVIERQQSSNATAQSGGQPVINTSGQMTGTVVNTTA